MYLCKDSYNPISKEFKGGKFPKNEKIIQLDWKRHIQIQKIRTKEKSRVKGADKQRRRGKHPKITAMLKAEDRATPMWN